MNKVFNLQLTIREWINEEDDIIKECANFLTEVFQTWGRADGRNVLSRVLSYTTIDMTRSLLV